MLEKGRVGQSQRTLKSNGEQTRSRGEGGLTISTRGDERVERRACADPHGGGGHVGVVGPGPGSRGADDGCEDKGALHGVLFTS